MYDIHVPVLLILLTITKSSLSKSCSLQCNNDFNCVNNDTAVYRPLGVTNEYLCHQHNQCFGSNSSLEVPVQQYPVGLLQNQTLFLNVSFLHVNNVSIEIVEVFSYNDFLFCNLTNFQKIYPMQIGSQLFSITNFTTGAHYLLFLTNDLFFSCKFGFRLQVHVYNDNCLLQNHTYCHNNGNCMLKDNLYSCKCCDGFYGDYCDEFDGCLFNSCVNNSLCIDIKNGSLNSDYMCSCLPQFTGDFCDTCAIGFTGDRCMTDIDECSVNKFVCNFGSCLNLNGSFECICPTNVTGKYCEIDLYNSCLSSPCSSNEACIDLYIGYNCRCLFGFTGLHCDVEINECTNHSCSAEGTMSCVDLLGNYACQCIPGYTGLYCETDIDECFGNSCFNGGLCVNLINKFQCACQPGFDGKRCENIANKCEVLKPCKNNATCQRSGNNLHDYTCLCLPGWTDKNCSTDINECQSQPCQNNATCVDMLNNFTCNCLVGWTGKRCESNVDMCQSELCQNNSTCIDSAFGLDYSCLCHSGFTSKHCEVNIDDCILNNVTCNHGECIDLVKDYYCKCDQGWYGKFCDTDRNLCSSRPCVHAKSCENLNTTSGFVCQCEPGYTDVYCLTNIDDCTNHKCQNGGVCMDLINNYNCSCPPGFYGEHCENKTNECISNPCQNNATCRDFINQFFCECNPGFNGTNCENNIDDCLEAPCKNNATCIDLVNNFTCLCAPGYNGKDCSLHVCESDNICRNNGTCIKEFSTGYYCTCDNHFTGKHCENSVNKCLLMPCKNNGTCNDLAEGFKCDCKYPYSGDFCENHLCDCNICRNGAKCIPSTNNYFCQCEPGFTGRNCEENINECLHNSCDVKGTLECKDLISNYSCICHKGFTGHYCDTHICNVDGFCNNGTCFPFRNGYRCDCEAGFEGLLCEKNINECQNVSCGTGKCVDGVNNYTCICPLLKNGRHCEIDLDFCSSSPCFNSGACTNDIANNTYHCNCSEYYSGKRCEKHICTASNLCNNGSCMILGSNFKCKCLVGYTGLYCENEIDECLSQPCVNNGICFDKFNNYSCTCLRNFTGNNCETFISFCNSTVCLNEGVCINNYTSMSYECQCVGTFSGPKCEFRECDVQNPCQNNGTCLRTSHARTCLCMPGYTSHDCSIEINECDSQPCLNNGNCTNLINDFQCSCLKNFTGSNCESFLTFCHNSCMNRGLCINNYENNTYYCQCPTDYTGHQCEVRLSGPCHPNPCQHNGLCDVTNTSYTCNCLFGFEGNVCEDFHCPCNYGRCLRKTNQDEFTCNCDVGYTGKYCETFTGDCRNSTITELKCSSPSFCKNTSYGFACVCPSHLQGERCDTAGGCRIATCFNGGTCIDDNRYRCICHAGYSGQFCQYDVNECLMDPCINGACAEDQVNSFKCFCSPGYTGTVCDNRLNNSTDVSELLSHISTPTLTIFYTTAQIEVYETSSRSSTLVTASLQSHIPTFSLNTGPFSKSILEINSTNSVGFTGTIHSVNFQFSSLYSNTFISNSSVFVSFIYLPKTTSGAATHLSKTTSDTSTHLSKTTSDASIHLSKTTSDVSGLLPRTAIDFSTLLSNTESGLSTFLSKTLLDTSTQLLKTTSPVSNLPTIISNSLNQTQRSLATRLLSTSSIVRQSIRILSIPTRKSIMATSVATTHHKKASLVSIARTMIVSSFTPLQTIIVPAVTPSITLTQNFVFSVGKTKSMTASTTQKTTLANSATTPTSVTTSVVTTNQPSAATTTHRPFLNLTCHDSPCNGYTCVNEFDNDLLFRCICPFPTYGPTCKLGSLIHYPRFNGFSHVLLHPVLMNDTSNTIVLSFHTTTSNGLLLYANHSLYDDFLSLFVEDGYLKFIFHTGAEIFEISSRDKIDSGDDLLVYINLDGGSGMATLTVNNKLAGSKYLPRTFRRIDVNSPWFIGGIPNDYLLRQHFIGCIKKLEVNGRPYSLTDPTVVSDWLSISDCDISACNRGACHNNATCIRNINNVDAYVCKCQPGYYGNNCRQITNYCQGDPCNDNGECISTLTGYYCLCYFGKLGTNCLIDSIISMAEYSVIGNRSSYIEYPAVKIAPKALERFEIRLQFSSVSNQNSLLAFLGQSTIGLSTDDFFGVGVHDDHILVIFNLGDGPTFIRSSLPIYSSRAWHFIVAGRTKQNGYLYFDSQDKVTSTSSGILSGLNVNTPLYIGGVPDFTKLPSILYAHFDRGFSGIIHDVAIRTQGFSFVPLLTLTSIQVASSMIGLPVEHGLNIKNSGEDHCKHNPCANNGTCITSGVGFTCRCVAPYKGSLCHERVLTCVDYNPCQPSSVCRSDEFMSKCECSFGWTGAFCNQQINISVPYFKKNSFLSLLPRNIRSSITLSIKFKADTINGLLFYVSQNIKSTIGDFFAISIWKGYVYVRLNLGSGTMSMRTRNLIQLHQWHVLYIRQAGKEAIMKLDDNYFIGVRGSGQKTKLDLSSMFYIGGVPTDSNINDAAMKNVYMQHDFVGCVQSLIVNGHSFILNTSNFELHGRDVGECGGSCINSNCENNADCISHTNNSYFCNCELGTYGRSCHLVQSSFTSAKFDNHSYWFTRSSQLSSASTAFIELSFKTKQNGLLLWHGRLRDATSDFLTVGFLNGKLTVTLQMDSSEQSVTMHENLFGSTFNKLRIDRVGSVVTFFVNGHLPRIVVTLSTKSTLNNDGFLYLGGLPGDVHELSNGRFTSSFTGCIANMTYTGLGGTADFASTLNTRGVNVEACNT